jgi:serine/threonine protein kinase/tetratricopeptide (TPR) repeat protein
VVARVVVKAKAKSFMTTTPPQPERLASTAEMPGNKERPGETVGRYKLRELIGEGGMGTVWIAEQSDPVRRKVALKLVKAGMDTREVLSRFEVERQALALMDHPHIAKIHDGGVTDTGRPFFVMEYVKGIPITQFCDEARLTVEERLHLFVPVCQAVQHAHQKGIIHRDLKPSNMLVCLYDGRPIPKIIDFGLAKAMHQPLTEHTLHTAHGIMVGTPQYMSPEQAEFNNLDVDTRTDVYSLGVILYELLTGSTPLERNRIKQATLPEILQLIKEEEPQKPSTKISGSGSLPTIALQRGLEPAQLGRLIKGDLDWIVMKALEKDRARRYETASGLAHDIQRYLNDEPVEACPPSLRYRVQKLARRYRRAIVTMALLGVVVLSALSVVAASVGWAVRDRQSRQAVVERRIEVVLDEVAAAVSQRRLSDAGAALKQADGLLATSEVDPAIATKVSQWKRDLDVVEQLQAIEQGGVTAPDGPIPGSAQAAAYQLAFDRYGLNMEPSKVDETAARIRESPIRLSLLTVITDGALSLLEPTGSALAGEYSRIRDHWLALAENADDDPWRARLREAVVNRDQEALVTLAKDMRWQQQPTVLVADLGLHLEQREAPDDAETLLTAAVQRYPRDFRINRQLGLYLLANYSPCFEAERHFRVCLVEQPENFEVRDALGTALFFNEQYGDAYSELQKALQLRPASANTHYMLGMVAQVWGQTAAAEESFHRAMQLDPAHRGAPQGLLELLRGQADLPRLIAILREATERAPEAVAARLCLGELQLEQDQWLLAEQTYRQVLRLDPNELDAHHLLANALERQGKLLEAEAAHRDGLALSADTAQPYFEYVAFLQRQQRWEEADTILKKAHEIDPESSRRLQLFNLNELGVALERHPNDLRLLLERGLAQAAANDTQEALNDLNRAVHQPLPDRSFVHSGQLARSGQAWLDAAAFLFEAGGLEEAGIAADRAIAELEVMLENHLYDGNWLSQMARAHVYSGSCRGNSAEQTRAFDRARRFDSTNAVTTHLKLARFCLGAGRFEEGAPHIMRVVEARPEDHLTAMQAAVLQLYRGDRPSYEHLCRILLENYGETSDPVKADRTAKSCLLSGHPAGELDVLDRLARVANADPQHGFYRFFILVEALAAYRRGDWQRSLDACDNGLARVGTSEDVSFLVAHYRALRAMAEYRLGQRAAAEASLTDAVALMKQSFPQAPVDLGFRWADWMLFEVLRREAADLLGMGQ